MDRVREFLEQTKKSGDASGNFLGLLHILIGRQIRKDDGTLVSHCLSWRELALWLKKVRWEKDAIEELRVTPESLARRDRFRYWFQVIMQAGVDSDEAIRAGERLAEKLRNRGYVVGPPPQCPTGQSA